jgi:adenine phosphoribosyltransferase
MLQAIMPAEAGLEVESWWGGGRSVIYYDVYPMELCGLHLELPIIPLREDLAIASFVLLGNVPLVNACAEAIAQRLRPYGLHMLVTTEAKGIPLVHQIATLLEMDHFALIRKGRKVYMRDPLVVDGASITTAGHQTFFLDGREAELIRDKRVAFVDDVVSTGGSRRAAGELIERAGGHVVCEAFVLKEGEWVPDHPDSIYLGRLPLFELAPTGGWRPQPREEVSPETRSGRGSATHLT